MLSGTLISLGVFFGFLITCFKNFLRHILEFEYDIFQSLLFNSLYIKILKR